MSGRSVLLWVLIPFISLCAVALWLTRPAPSELAPSSGQESAPTPTAPLPPPEPAVPPAPPHPRAEPPSPVPAPPPASRRTFGEGSTLPSRSPPPPPITLPEAEPHVLATTGPPVDPEEVRRAIHSVVPLMRECFQDVAERYPGSQSITLKFTLGGPEPEGHFRDGQLVETTIQDPIAQACFLDSLLDARFPTPRGGGTVTLTYPFRFERGTDAGR